jgi:hypothetical protein
MKHKVWVKVGNDPEWYSNSMEYDSEELAKAAASDLAWRWTLVVDFTTAPVGTHPNEVVS